MNKKTPDIRNVEGFCVFDIISKGGIHVCETTFTDPVDIISLIFNQ